MLKNLVFGALLAASSTVVQADTVIPANPEYSAYLQDGHGIVVRSATGLCWRTAYWTPGDAVIGCDGELMPPVMKPTAPPIVPPIAMPSKPAVPKAAVPERCDFSITLGNGPMFGFDRAVLDHAAQKRIDAEVLAKLPACSRIESITITGHTDRLGSRQYNQKLSEKRANAVAAYLKRKGVSARIDTQGVGETQPIQSCSDTLAHTKLISCLAPNRRVVIEVQGIVESQSRTK